MRHITHIALAALILLAVPPDRPRASVLPGGAPVAAFMPPPSLPAGPQLDRSPSLEYPQMLPYSTPWAGFNFGSGDFQDLGNNNQAFLDAHGLITAYSPVQWYGEPTVVTTRFNDRSLTGYSKPKSPNMPNWVAPDSMAAGPDGSLHAVWVIRQSMVDGYGQATEGSFLRYRVLKNGIWSGASDITPLQPWVYGGAPKIHVTKSGFAHMLFIGWASNPYPWSTHYGSRFLAYTSSAGGYHVVDGTQAEPLWVGDAGMSGQGDINWFETRMLDDNNVALVWAGWFPNDTRGRTWGIHYYRGPIGGPMPATPQSLFVAAPVGSLGTHWGTDTWGVDAFGNDHMFYQVWGAGPVIHLVNGSAVEQFTLPANVVLGRMVGFDSRGQCHIVGNGFHWLKRTDGTWIYGPTTITTGYQGQLTFGRNDQMFIVDQGEVLQELSRTLGVRDAAAHTAVMPGGSVDLVTGNFHYQLPLFSSKGVGPCQSMALYYNSMDNRSGVMSPGWKLNYEMYLTYHGKPWQQGQTMSLTLPDGRSVVFRGGPSGYIADAEYGYSAYIQATDPNINNSLDTQYTMTTVDGTKYLFDKNGKLISITDPSQNRLDLIYSTDGYLTQVIDMLGNGGSGRSSYIEYTAAADPNYPRRISRIVDPLGATYTMKYNGWNLESVTFGGVSPEPKYTFTMDSKTVKVGPSDILIERLTKVTTPLGGDWLLEYLPDGRVRNAYDPDGKSIFFYYDETIAAGQPRKTYVNDRRYFTYEYTLEERRSLALNIKDPGYDPIKGIFDIVRTFDADAQLLSVSNRWGKVTTYTYAPGTPNNLWARGLLATVKRPSATGATQETVLSNTWTATAALAPIVITSSSTYATPTSTNATPNSVWTRTTGIAYADSAARHLPTRIDYPIANIPDGSTQSAFSTVTYGGPRKQVSQAVDEEGHTVDFSNFDSANGLPRRILRQGGTQPEELLYDVMGNVIHRKLPQGGSGNDAGTGTVYGYDSLQRLILTNDAAGHMTAFGYDAGSNLVQIAPATGAHTFNTYDKFGRPTGGTTPDGSWSKEYDAHSNILSSTDIRGQKSTFVYDFMGRVTNCKVPGATTVGGFGGGGPGMHDTKFEHEIFSSTTGYSSTTTQVGSPSDRVTTTTFDNRGRPVTVTAPDGHTKTTSVYDEQGQVVAAQQYYDGQIQGSTLYFRDARDRVNQVRSQDTAYLSNPTKQSNAYTIYNKVGSVFKVVDPLGSPTAAGSSHKTTYFRDARERVTSVVDGKGNIVQETTYGDDDLPIEVKVPDPKAKGATLASLIKYEYTGRKELKRSTDRNGATTSATYNLRPGEVAQVTDPVNRITANTYHAQTRRLTQTVEAQGTLDARTTNYVWTNGLLTETQVFNPETGGVNASYKNFYDQAGRLERREYPTVATGTQMAAERHFYNSFGEMRQQIAGSRLTNLSYDSRGLLTGRSWSGPASGSETRTYTNAGLPSSVSNGVQTMNYTWNTWQGTPLDDIFVVNGQTWKIHTKTTDLAGNVTALLDTENKLHEWPVDENNRPIEKKLSGQGVSAISYTPGGLIDTETLKDAAGAAIAKTVHSYDPMGRLAQSHTVKVSTSETLAKYSYKYDAGGQVTDLEIGHLGATFSITTDNVGRIKTQNTAGNSGGATAPPFTNTLVALSQGNESVNSSEAQATPSTRIAVPARNASYAYAASGNRVSQTVDGVTTTYNYNALNQLTSETSPTQTVTYQYDEFGNQTQRVTAVSGGSTTTEAFGYNHQNLMSVYANSTTGATYQYDYQAEGERYSKTNLTTNVSEIYANRDGDVVADYTKNGGSAPVLQNTYVQGHGIDSKSMRLTSGGARRYFLGDVVGTVGAVMDHTASLVETSVRDAWGRMISGVTGERFGYAQREHDGENGLVYMRWRMYDPRTGRFTQNDPLRSNRPFEHYSYGRSNPLLHNDPQGLAPLGHHIIPEAFWEDLADKAFIHGAKVKAALNSFRIGDGIPGHNFTMHGVYNTLVGKELKSFLQSNNLKSIAEFTEQHVSDFVKQIRSNPAAEEFLQVVHNALQKVKLDIGGKVVDNKFAQKQYTKYVLQEFSFIQKTSHYVAKFKEFGRRLPFARIAIALIAGGAQAYEALKKRDPAMFGDAALKMGLAYCGVDIIQDVAGWGGQVFGEFADRVCKAYTVDMYDMDLEELKKYGLDPDRKASQYVDREEPVPKHFRDRDGSEDQDPRVPQPQYNDRYKRQREREERESRGET